MTFTFSPEATNVTVGYISLDLSKEAIVRRLLAMKSETYPIHFRTGQITDKEWECLVEASSIIGDSKLLLAGNDIRKIEDIIFNCQESRNKNDINVVFVDDYQHIRHESDQDEKEEILSELKQLAMSLEITIVLISQISNVVEDREDHRPRLSDFREGGCVERIADKIIFLYRDEYYTPDSEKRGLAELIIPMQRDGEIGTVQLEWQPAYLKFYEWRE